MRTLITTIVATASIIITSCSPTQNTTQTLKGKWLIINANGVNTANGEEQAFIAFEDSGKVYGNTSINRFFGTYTQDGQKLTLSDRGTTMRMGQNPEIEQAVNTALNNVASFTLNGDSATLLDASGKQALLLIRYDNPQNGHHATTASLTGQWLITKAFDHPTSSSENTAFITFSPDGKINGCTGANKFFGSCSIDASSITFSNIGTTRMFAGPYQDTENAVLKALDEAKSFSINGNQATISDASNTIILILTRQ